MLERKKTLSNVYNHFRTTDHPFNYDLVKMLAQDRKINALKQLERVYTLNNGYTINRAVDIHQIYQPVFVALRK